MRYSRDYIERRKTMETPLIGNRREEDASSREVAEASVYTQLVGSLMYSVNTQICVM